jgi:uncharacterized protein (TIGR02466 family)
MITDTFTFKEDISVFKGKEEYTPMIIDKLYQLKAEDSQTDGHSNIKGWQKEINNKIEYIHIRTMIMNEFVDFFKKNIGDFNMEVSIVKFFVNINPPGASHSMHHHEGGQYSGAYWLQGDKDAGNIIIMNPYPNSFINTFCQAKNNYNYNSIEIPPKSNTGVFFNSNLIHYVDLNRSNKDRISFGFHLHLKEKYTI